MEMPDTIEIYKHYTEISPHKTEYELELWQAEYDHGDGETYHHSRIVEALKAKLSETVIHLAARNSEIKELKAKLDKAKLVISYYADKQIYSRKIKVSRDNLQLLKAPVVIDGGEYARTTLEELK